MCYAFVVRKIVIICLKRKICGFSVTQRKRESGPHQSCISLTGPVVPNCFTMCLLGNDITVLSFKTKVNIYLRPENKAFIYSVHK